VNPNFKGKEKNILLIFLGGLLALTLLFLSLLYAGKYHWIGAGLNWLGVNPFLEAKELGKGMALVDLQKDGSTLLVRPLQNNSSFAPFCGTKIQGEILEKGVLYKNKVYVVYTDLGIAGEDDLGYTHADVIYLRNGEVRKDLEIQKIPVLLRNLSSAQVYGQEALPNRIKRLDKEFYLQLDAPLFTLVVGSTCDTFVMTLLGVDVLLGIAILLRFLVRR
jgi:hypothetical protein